MQLPTGRSCRHAGGSGSISSTRSTGRALVYMLGRIQRDVDHHGVRPRADVIADLLVEDLNGEPELRRKVPELLQALHEEGAVIEVDGEWRLQTRESAEWEQAYRTEERRVCSVTRRPWPGHVVSC
jgi:hypothetical protein